MILVHGLHLRLGARTDFLTMMKAVLADPLIGFISI
jgi:hypothetical protein